MTQNSTQFDNHPEAADIYHLLDEYFILDDLQTLCLLLDVRYDKLAGEGLSAKARELVLLMVQLERLDDLWTQMVAARPFLADQPSAPSLSKGQRKDRLSTAIPFYADAPYGLEAAFTGRADELKLLDEWLAADPDHPLLAIIGLGGVGKSALSCHPYERSYIQAH